MSDARKEQRPLDSDFPGEEQLSRLYQEGSEDLPPVNLDAVILDAARQAVHARPRRVYFFPSRKWVVPLSLAAALWVTLAVVRMQRTEITSLRLNAPSSSVSQPESSAVTPQRADELTDKPLLPSFAPAPSEEKALTRRKLTEPQAKQALRARDREHDALDEGTARGLAPLPPSFRMQAVQPSANQTPRDERETAEEKTDTVADVGGGQAETALEQPAQAASGEQERPAREFAAPTSAPPLLSDAPIAAGTITTEARKEPELSPKEWIARIKELRRAGKFTEAEASLKALKKRYPEYPMGKFLQEQPEAFHAPKE
jgi:hypothetical protein